jgi:hypothetical protein
MAQAPGKLMDVKVVIDQLRSLNLRIERLIAQVPTSDDQLLAELDTLMNTLQRTLMIQTTRERGSLFFEQATDKAMGLKARYQTLLAKGMLRKKK